MVSRKVVLDTSVFIAGIIGHGASKEILMMILDCNLKIVLSREIIIEYVKVLSYPRIAKRLKKFYVLSIISALYKKAVLVTPGKHIKLCRDPDDDKFIEAAFEAKAVLISFDDDILSLRNNENVLQVNNQKILILTPSEFLKLYKSKQI